MNLPLGHGILLLESHDTHFSDVKVTTTCIDSICDNHEGTLHAIKVIFYGVAFCTPTYCSTVYITGVASAPQHVI